MPTSKELHFGLPVKFPDSEIFMNLWKLKFITARFIPFWIVLESDLNLKLLFPIQSSGQFLILDVYSFKLPDSIFVISQ